VITGSTEVKEYSPIDEYTGALSPNFDRGLMRSVIENDQLTIEHGRLITDSINQGMMAFTPSMLFEHLVKNYSLAKNIFGEAIIRRLTGYEPGSIEKNINLPEFQRELLGKIEERFGELKEEGLLDSEGAITEKAVDLASMILYTEELDKIAPKGSAGDKIHRKQNPYGLKDEIKSYTKGRYRDIAIRKSVRKAMLRGHKEIQLEDLMSYKRKSKGHCSIIYGLDASGSMKGKKLEKCKKAGIALAYRAIEQKDSVGLLIFGADVKAAVKPSQDFTGLLREIAKARASAQTDIAGTIREAARLFYGSKVSKHLVLITDALPTKGAEPEQETLDAAAMASAEGITISLVGIGLDSKGRELAEKIVERGNGRLFIVKDLEEVDSIVLMDYYGVE